MMVPSVAAPAYRRLTAAPKPGYHVMRNSAAGLFEMIILIALLYTITCLGFFIAVAVHSQSPHARWARN